MTNNEHENEDIDIEITDNEHTEIEDTELTDIEESSSDKIKALRKKLSESEEAKMKILEDSQRDKADFLNAKRRMEEERVRDRIRYQKQHVMELLPLCDSFEMAMSNTEAWEKADKNWRVGVEGINTQLLKLLESYQVRPVNPEGEDFDPHKHEAIGTEEVEDEDLKDKVITVVQRGYELNDNGKTEIIRPARVTTGITK